MDRRALRFLYVGLPLGAVVLARAGFVPKVACLGHPDAPGARRVRKRLGKLGTLVLGRPELDRPEIVSLIESVRPDVILSWFWPRLVPKVVLDLAPRGAFGVHPSLLPALRGPDPYFWAILRGLPETGVTLHRLAEGYDTGHVIDARALTIAPEDDAFKLARRLDRPSLRLLLSCAERLAAGEALSGEPQDEARASEAPKPDDDLYDIDWREPAAHIAKLVRASGPLPGAHAELGDELVDVLWAVPFDGDLPRALEPADAVLTERGVVVCTGRGGLLVTCVRREDDSLLRGAEVARLFPGGLARWPRKRTVR